MSQGDENGMMSEINVTPFVDVMLVLLIIFMVTAPMITMTQGMEVNLPDAEANAMTADEKTMVLSITEDSKYYINEREFNISDLSEKLVALSKANPEQEIFIKADGSVPYEKVAQLMSACTNAGITKLGMITESPENE